MSSQLAWIHSLPLKRRNVFALDYVTRLVSLVQMVFFHLAPLSALYLYCEWHGRFLTELRSYGDAVRTFDVRGGFNALLHLEMTPMRLSVLFGSIALLHILALTSTQNLGTGQAALDRNRQIRAKGIVRYFIDLDFIRKAQVISIILIALPLFRPIPRSEQSVRTLRRDSPGHSRLRDSARISVNLNCPNAQIGAYLRVTSPRHYSLSALRPAWLGTK